MNDAVKATLGGIIAGFEAALELERELGVRSFQCERALLAPVQAKTEAAEVPAPPAVSAPASSPPKAVPRGEGPQASPGAGEYDFIFLHHRALGAEGAAMMDRIVSALGRDCASAPVVVDAPLPRAKAYVVLGSFALRKFFPTLRGMPGQWIKGANGEEVLVSNSPEYILRFGAETPSVKKIKQDMWRSLKTVKLRLGVA